MLCSMRDIIDRYKKSPEGAKTGTSSDVCPFPPPVVLKEFQHAIFELVHPAFV
jgi:hypothetical protein